LQLNQINRGKKTISELTSTMNGEVKPKDPRGGPSQTSREANLSKKMLFYSVGVLSVLAVLVAILISTLLPPLAASMEGRAVWTERVPMKGWMSTAVHADHWAVWVDDNCYEVERDTTTGGAGSNTINGNINGAAKNRDKEGSLTLSGTTLKTDQQIEEENQRWIREHPRYDLLGANCQKYSQDMIHFLVGGSYEPPCPLPQAGMSTWLSTTAASHHAESKGVTSSKWTSGRVGAVWRIFGFDAEGPKIARGSSVEYFYGNYGPYFEAALFRLEAKVFVFRARIELNVNSGLGFRDGQLQIKMAGLGLSMGSNGVGVSTPLGGVGLGKF
jgi:hypothetical protein